MRAHFFLFSSLTWLALIGLVFAQTSPSAPVSAPALAMAVPDEAQAPLFALFQEELERLQKGIPFAKLVLLDTSQAAYRSYAAQGLLRQNDVSFTHLESGLAAVAINGGTVNGNAQAVCYVLYSPEQAGPVYRNFVVPITKAADERSAAAFLMGHEVAHCLDHFERFDVLRKKMIWSADEVAPIGLSPIAVTRVFGANFASGNYFTQGVALYKDSAQAQYEERVADAFGMAWVWRLGGKQAVLDALIESRSHANPWDVHATAPVLVAMGKNKSALTKTDSLADVWALARKTQLEVGVDPSLGKDSPHVLNPMAQYLDQPMDTPKVDKPRALPQPKGKNFNDLPQFGVPSGF